MWLFCSIEAQSRNLYNVFLFNISDNISCLIGWDIQIHSFVLCSDGMSQRQGWTGNLAYRAFSRWVAKLLGRWSCAPTVRELTGAYLFILLLTLECPVKSLSVISPSPTVTVPSCNLDEVVKTWSLKVQLSLTSPALVCIHVHTFYTFMLQWPLRSKLWLLHHSLNRRCYISS